MPNVSNLGKLDLSAIDVRTMTPEEWDAVKQEAARRAHAERAMMSGRRSPSARKIRRRS